MDLRNSNGIELRNFYLPPCMSFVENFHQKWKNASCGTQLRYFQKILIYESPMQSYLKN